MPNQVDDPGRSRVLQAEGTMGGKSTFGTVRALATVAIQVTRNATSVDTTNTSCANETSITPPEPGSNLNLGVTASGKAAYNAGDLVQVFVLQRNRAGNAVLTGENAFDLTFDVLWVDSL
jgi:hypothetical protein